MNPFRRFQQIVVVLAALSASGGSVLAAPEGWSPLLEPEELAVILEAAPDVRVVRLTGEYEAGHIPGAVSIAYPQFRGPRSNPGQLPDLSALTRLLQQAGIDADTPVVLVHQGNGAVDMGAATRVYWTLRSLGVDDLAVLNGGFNAWQSARLPVSTDDVAVPASGFEPQWNDQWQVTTAELERMVDSGTSARIVDARPEPYFLGQQTSAARAGTIPGSENLSFTGWFDGDRMKNEEELSDMLPSDDAGNGAVTFCNTGHLASINWFVMNEMAGLDGGTRLYAESVTEWARSPDRPMENEPRDGQ
jgi:thiosulfate/3-mercaptopyruvate sulfurtransferase